MRIECKTLYGLFYEFDLHVRESFFPPERGTLNRRCYSRSMREESCRKVRSSRLLSLCRNARDMLPRTFSAAKASKHVPHNRESLPSSFFPPFRSHPVAQPRKNTAEEVRSKFVFPDERHVILDLRLH